MRHSQKIHDAMQKVFDKLLALSPKELAERLEKREVGPIGHLMRETGTIDVLCEQYDYSVYSLINLDGFTEQVLTSQPFDLKDFQKLLALGNIAISQQEEADDYIVTDTEMNWLKAA